MRKCDADDGKATDFDKNAHVVELILYEAKWLHRSDKSRVDEEKQNEMPSDVTDS